MKKLFLILALIPIMATGQSFKELIKKYEAYCNEIVQDTVVQEGTITEKFERIKGTDYWAVKLDTVWDKVDCPEYKYYPKSRYLKIDTGSYLISSNDLIISNSTGPMNGTEKGEIRRRWITRDYICECKRREVEPFSEDFWKWIKKQ